MTMLASISSGEARRRLVDGRAARPEDDRRRPAISLFMPDRLALVKGPPSPRRAHLDRLAAALRPARAELPPRLRPGARAAQQPAHADPARGRPGSARRLGPRARRARARRWSSRGARRPPSWSRRSPRPPRRSASPAAPRSPTGRAPASSTPTGSSPSSRERRDGDVARGFTGYGPHRDEVELSFGGRSLRRYGSQGQQRLGLLALLFAEREALRAARRRLPLMLLDDVMSELDPERRRRLVEMLERDGAGADHRDRARPRAGDARRASSSIADGTAVATERPDEPSDRARRRAAEARRGARPAGLRAALRRRSSPRSRARGRRPAGGRSRPTRSLSPSATASSRSPARAASGRRNWS